MSLYLQFLNFLVIFTSSDTDSPRYSNFFTVHTLPAALQLVTLRTVVIHPSGKQRDLKTTAGSCSASRPRPRGPSHGPGLRARRLRRRR